ncbi:hypothetical protein, partial [Vibrio parahaemolyticus]
RLTGLPVGEWRDLTADELIELFDMMEKSESDIKPKKQAKTQATSKNGGGAKQNTGNKPKAKPENPTRKKFT